MYQDFTCLSPLFRLMAIKCSVEFKRKKNAVLLDIYHSNSDRFIRTALEFWLWMYSFLLWNKRNEFHSTNKDIDKRKLNSLFFCDISLNKSIPKQIKLSKEFYSIAQIVEFWMYKLKLMQLLVFIIFHIYFHIFLLLFSFIFYFKFYFESAIVFFSLQIVIFQ